MTGGLTFAAIATLCALTSIANAEENEKHSSWALEQKNAAG